MNAKLQRTWFRNNTDILPQRIYVVMSWDSLLQTYTNKKMLKQILSYLYFTTNSLKLKEKYDKISKKVREKVIENEK